MKNIVILLLVLLSHQSVAQDLSLALTPSPTRESGIGLSADQIANSTVKLRQTDTQRLAKLLQQHNQLLLTDTSIVQIDKKNPRKKRTIGINIIGGGAAVIGGFSLDAFVTPSINIEAGIGFLGVFGGIDYHFSGERPKKWTSFIGAHIMQVGGILGEDPSYLLYLPLGIQYTGYEAFSFSVEIAHVYRKPDFTTDFGRKRNLIWGALKLGLRF